MFFVLKYAIVFWHEVDRSDTGAGPRKLQSQDTKSHHHDSFKINKKFCIQLNAKIPDQRVTFVPEYLDFGFVAVCEPCTLTFDMTNNGDSVIKFKWFLDQCPIDITPSCGEIQPLDTQSFEAHFISDAATCVEIKMPCRINDDQFVTFIAEATVTYPFFKLHDNDSCNMSSFVYSTKNLSQNLNGNCLSNVVVDMGCACVGETIVRKIELQNCSAVKASFSLQRINFKQKHNTDKEENENDDDDIVGQINDVVTILPEKGLIDPSGTQECIVSYCPRSIASKTTQHYQILTPSGYSIPFTIVGSADSPDVQADKSLIDFGCISYDTSSTKTEMQVVKTLKLKNYSHSVDCWYEFQCDELQENSESSFTVSPKRGVISPEGTMTVEIAFSPNSPMIYKSNLFCIVHQQIPLKILLVGGSYNDINKTEIQAVYINTLEQWATHQEKSPVFELDIHNKLIDMSHKHFKQYFSLFSKTEEHNSNNKNIMINSTQDARYIKNESAPILQLSTQNVKFAACTTSQGISASETITIYNKSNSSNVSLKWDVIGTRQDNLSADDTNDTSKTLFSIFPTFVDIAPLASANFSISFQPAKDSSFFSSIINCCFQYDVTNNEEVANTNQNNQHPNTIHCIGSLPFVFHGSSFAGNNELIIPKPQVALSSEFIEFTPCSVGASVYATIKLTNTSDNDSCVWNIKTPSQLGNEQGQVNDAQTFRDNEKLRQMFQFCPKFGFIPPNGFQLVVCKFEPRSEGIFEYNPSISYNHVSKYNKTIHLTGLAVKPQLRICDNNGTLFIRPTCIGMSCTEKILLHNISSIPIKYEIETPDSNLVMSESAACGTETVSARPVLQSKIVNIFPKKGLLNVNEKKHVLLKFTPQKVMSYEFNVRCYYYSTLTDDDIVSVVTTRPNTASEYFHNKRQNYEQLRIPFKTLKIVGQCNQSIVEFVPTKCNFDSILINVASRKFVYIQNNSDNHLECNIKVNSDYHDIIKLTGTNYNIPPKTRKLSICLSSSNENFYSCFLSIQ